MKKAQEEIKEQNKEVVLGSIRGIDAQDSESLRNLWAEDFSCHSLDMPEPFGREETIEYIQDVLLRLPGQHP